MVTMDIQTDERGVEYVEDATYSDLRDKLPGGWALCETCHRAWNDDKSTGVTPAPSGRCPFEYEHETDEPNIWTMLEQAAPDGCDDVQDLYSWSLNYDTGKGPFTLFLDLIGWSDDNLGAPLYSLADAPSKLGYVELSKLADALSQYSDRPQDVRAYVDALMAAESRG